MSCNSHGLTPCGASTVVSDFSRMEMGAERDLASADYVVCYPRERMIEAHFATGTLIIQIENDQVRQEFVEKKG